MALIQCPECNHTVSNRAASCPGCGFILNPQYTQRPLPPPQQLYPVYRERDPDLRFISGWLKARMIIGIVLLIIFVAFPLSQRHY
jgi:hypothetical protein